MRRLPRIALAMALVVICCMLSGCYGWSLLFDGHGTGLRTRLRGDGNIATTTQTLDAQSYTLNIEDIAFDVGLIHGRETASITADPSLAREVIIESDQNVLDTIEISVTGDKIRIKGNPRTRYDYTKMNIIIGADISEIYVQGGFEMALNQPNISTFSLTADGALSGDMTFGTLDSLDMIINGAGSLTLKGECQDMSAMINGAASLYGYALICDSVSVRMNGAGSSEVYAVSKLTAAINGVGSLTYDGPVQDVDRRIAGIGSIKHK